MNKAIIIGASSGIGRELAKILDAHHFKVGIVARRLDLLKELQIDLQNESYMKQIDISKIADAQEKLNELITQMEGVDLIVISAGIGYINPELDLELEMETISTNVMGFTAMANIAIKQFIKQGSGHLVGISSIAAIRGDGENPAYNASKAFMSNYLQGLRKNIIKANLPIIVTDIKPGFVDTAMAKGDNLFWVASREKAANQIFNAIKKKKSHVYITKRCSIIAWFLRILPDVVYNRI